MRLQPEPAGNEVASMPECFSTIRLIFIWIASASGPCANGSGCSHVCLELHRQIKPR
jgi:hypothetical protein